MIEPQTGAQWLAFCFIFPLANAPIWAFVLQAGGVAAALRLPIWKAVACLLILVIPVAMLGLMTGAGR